ncbi:dual specificity protein kinase yak1, partial [Coemansia spiralis]
MMEVQMLDLLNKKYDVHDRHHILRLREWFVFRNHLVLVNELLSINLYDLLKQNQYQGLSTNLVRVLVQQILDAMIVLKQAQVIHADLKPENILLEGMEKPVVKVIDFGSACFEWQTTFVYIQSRFYRSPEILLGLPYSSRIDMWSLGCIVAELYLGLPLFPGSSEYNQLSRIVDLLGIPPRSMLDRARRTDEFFNYLGPDTWDLKGMAQYASEHNTEEKPSKRFFQATTLEELIKTCPIRRRMSETEQHREFQSRLALIDFLRGLLQLDPDRRWSPHQAAAHPFITGEPFLGPFVPASDTGASSGSRGPYGTAPGSGHYHSGGGGGSGGGSSTSGGGGGGGGSGHPHTIGYSSRYGAAPGASGYAAHMMYGGGGGSGGGSGASSVFGPSAPYSGAVDAATWAYRGSGAGGAVSGADGLLSIPGAFPVIDSSGTQSRRSSQHVEQPPLLLPPPPMRTVSKGRSRATTLGHQVGAVLTQGGLPEHVPLDSGHGHSYAQHSQAEGFLGLDPSTSHTSDSPPTDGEPRDVPGRLDASLSSSEYSVGAGWASWSETNYSSNGQSSNIGGHETQAGSTQGPKGAPEPLALRSYLLSERQRQRLAQQRLLHQSDLASGNGARTRLVSNMSPLTLPSTPGSSVYSSRYMGGSAHERLLGSVPEAAHRVADLPEHYANSNSGSRSGSEAGSSNLSAAASGDLGFPRPLTQAAESASSLGLYFDGSGRESDASSLDGSSSSDEADYEQLSDEDADDSSSEHSDGSDGDTCGLPLPPALAIRASCELWSCPAPEHDADSASFSSLRFAVGQSLPDSRSSIYTLPRYAAYSQDVLSSGALAHRAAVEQESFSGEEDGHVYIDVASVISQEMSGFASPLENPEAEAVAGRMGDLHTDFGTNADS